MCFSSQSSGVGGYQVGHGRVERCGRGEFTEQHLLALSLLAQGECTCSVRTNRGGGGGIDQAQTLRKYRFGAPSGSMAGIPHLVAHAEKPRASAEAKFVLWGIVTGTTNQRVMSGNLQSLPWSTASSIGKSPPIPRKL